MNETYADRSLNCRDCGAIFIWTSGEQAFYASKNLMNVPSRCPSCRTRARASRGSGTPQQGRTRELFPVVCSKCGVQTQVPFMPRDDRPVYCSNCYDQVRYADKPSHSFGT